ncbi:hypothetical protein [Vibrio campbellii]|uniref:hypothetical protein n=1 Tax=Vibrio campbellii TaxID=680 RepID=UPI00249AB447|nr:hypothetical protein [Vibrio campbellii]
MKKLSLLAAVILTGCATQPAPNYVNGQHYLAGDEKCAMHYGTDEYGRMICADSEGVRTGEYRSPMSDVQVQAWYAQKNSQSQQSSLSSTVKCKKAIALNSPVVEYANGVCPVGWIKI